VLFRSLMVSGRRCKWLDSHAPETLREILDRRMYAITRSHNILSNVRRSLAERPPQLVWERSGELMTAVTDGATRPRLR